MSNWLENQRSKRAAELVAQYPTVTAGMFVQLTGWFGDVWAEIDSAYHADDPIWCSVSFYRYEKHGRTRKHDSAYYGDIRKFARREDIDFATGIVYTPASHHSFGTVVEWPVGQRFRQDSGGYEVHPMSMVHVGE